MRSMVAFFQYLEKNIPQIPWRIAIFSLPFLLLVGCSASEDDHQGDRHDSDEVHYHAAFHIYLDGELQDFSSDEFMQGGACSVDPNYEPDLTLPVNRIHLHDNIGEVVHVHAEEVTWREIFLSLEIDSWLEGRAMVSYRNGEVDRNVLDEVVAEHEVVIFALGEPLPEAEEMIANQPTQKIIDEAEQIVESCGF